MQPSQLTISSVSPNWNIAMDRSAAEILSEFYIEILPPDRNDTYGRMQRHARGVEG